MDKIIVPGIPLFVRVGWTAEERATEQELSVHVELRLDLRPAGSSDELARAVDYDDLCERVASLVGSGEFRLIEAIAEACARRLLADFPMVHEVRVEVRKPGALRTRGVPYAAVEVTRRRA